MKTTKEIIVHSEEKIRQAFRLVWAATTNQETTKALFSIPPRPDEDADFILGDAIDELVSLRANAPKWISVKERLPEAEGEYWAWTGKEVVLTEFVLSVEDENGNCSSKFYFGDSFYFNDDIVVDLVLAWSEYNKPSAPTEAA